MQTDILLEDILNSGVPVRVSGQIITAIISGQPVLISGQPMLISGQVVIVSGQFSGMPVSVSNQPVIVSGQPMGISGQAVIVSGQIVNVSGQPIQITGRNITPSLVSSYYNVVGSSFTNVVLTSDGALMIADGFVVDPNNSTSTPLGAFGNFIGVIRDLTGFSQIIITVRSDVPSNIDGLKVLFHFDNTYVADTKMFTIFGNNDVSIRIPIGAKFYRIYYSNGATPQGTFFLQSILNPIPSTATIKNIDTTIIGREDAMTTHSVIAGPNAVGGSSFSDVIVSPIGAMTVSMSGQPISISGQVVIVSGQILDRTWQLSGLTDSVAISGQTIIAEISGQSVVISGQPVLISGQVVIVSGQFSGQPVGRTWLLDALTDNVSISGQPVQISGQIINALISGQSVLISGQSVVTLSGSNVSVISGLTVDTGNSTTTLLGAGGVFTGVVRDLTGYSQVDIMVFTDQISAVNGLSAQFSTDGINFDHTHPNTISASTSESIHLAVDARYFRIVYTNGATPQGTFRLQTLLSPIPSQGTIKDIDLPLLGKDDALATHSVITGVTTAGGGAYVDVKVAPSGAIQVGGSITVLSGSIVDISGNAVLVSGQPVQISGQTILTQFASGVAIPTSISGQPVQVSGQTIVTQFASGVTFPVDISGQTVIAQFASGVTIATSVSGQPVHISGEVVIISGQFVSISGQAVRISGQVITGNLGRTWTLDKSTDSVLPQLVTTIGTYSALKGNESGILFVVFLSGDNTVTVSGQPVSISGQTINISGQFIGVSGQPMQITGLNITPSPISSYYNVVGSSFMNAVMTSDGALMVAEGSVVDPNNSTDAQLGAFGIFAGQFRDLTGYSQITLSIYSDVVPPSNGLQVYFSNDGISFLELKFFTVTGFGDVIHLPVNAKFYTIQFSNGATPTSTFKIQASLKPIPSTGTIKELNKVISLWDDALTTHSIITAPIPFSTSYKDIAATEDGKLWTLSFVSGQNLGRTWQLSGITDSVRISGQVVNISGQIVNISGQSVVVFGLAQGTPIGLEANTAGNLIAAISGQSVVISGQIVNTSGQVANISGQGITILGQNIVGLPTDTRFNVVGSSFSEAVTTSGGAIMVANGLEPDANNITTTALGIGGSYNGASRDLTGYSQITINVVTDVPGTLAITWSTGFATGAVATNYFSIIGSLSGTENETIHVPVNAKFYRIGYTNGAVAQSIFRLQSLLSPIPSVGFIRSIDRPIEAREDAMITHSVIAGPIAVGGSSFEDAVVTSDGLLTVNISGQMSGMPMKISLSGADAAVDGYNKSLIVEDVIHRKIHQGMYFYADVSQSASQSNPASYAMTTMSGVNPQLSWHFRGLTPGSLVNVLEVTSARQTTGTVSSNIFLNRTVIAFTSTRLYSSYVLGSNVGANSILFETMASGNDAYGFGNLYTYPLIPGEWVLKGGFTYVFQVLSARLPSLTTLYTNWYESGLA